jgi:hypothetical protein
MSLSPRFKKLLGTLGILIWITLYVLFLTRVAIIILPHAHWLVSLLFYAVAGLAWIIPVGLALPWMHRDRRR